jgi:hypothetical protein
MEVAKGQPFKVIPERGRSHYIRYP